ncbi:MAG: PEP-CTERM sorting domain-containing protein, partial [Bryobacteraceae bacterium]
NNGGAINLQSGSTLAISGDLNQSVGSGISLTDGNTFLHVGGNLTNGGASLTNGANLTVVGNYTQSGATLSLDGIGTSFQSGSFTQEAGSAVRGTNTATAVVNGSFINNGGAINLQSGSTLAISGDLNQSVGSGISLTDPNTFLHVGGNLTNGGASLTNGANLTVGSSYSQSGATLSLDGIGTSFQSGSFTQDASSAVRGTNTAMAVVNGSFTNNGGAINLQSGSTLAISGDLKQSVGSGISLTDPNTLLHVGGDLTNGGASLTNGANLTVVGNYTQSDAILKLDGVGTSFQSGSFTQDASSLLSLTNSAAVVVDGPFVNSGGIVTLQSSSNVTVDGFTINDGTTIVDVSAAWVNNGDVTNNGDLIINGSLDAGTNVYVQDQGVTTVSQGSTLTAGEVMINAGLLTGTGTIAGSLVNSGTDDPGALDAQTILGDYTQTTGGVLDIELGENGRFASLAISGDATLSGELDVSLYAGFDTQLNDRFPILTFEPDGLTSGTNFIAYDFPTWNGLTFQEVIEPDEIDLVVISDAPADASPEPSTLVLLFSALPLGVIGWLRRFTTRGSSLG